ncbi:hypothetical protein V6N11_052406 [Hibiscus sabdariffa]|uniref:Uncharacterized protein n=1 Tax=Hibiscus sabdariffa TaxID=183260 RepID=A0ABR2UAP7_9ROSI
MVVGGGEDGRFWAVLDRSRLYLEKLLRWKEGEYRAEHFGGHGLPESPPEYGGRRRGWCLAAREAGAFLCSISRKRGRLKRKKGLTLCVVEPGDPIM